ncbi:serine--tRNA ligase [Candidatus Peregrinibacteria bacterium HGW-Peregrinibacteria-1]|jgi:seryl-tRNA synthetase|nr:MAG: serine--tRNA ligase [Candidatus Peregrinibacteria bacterium HGW-Peregrinibacteria-1]
MIDIKFITANPDIIKKGATRKMVTVDIDQIIQLDDKRRTSLQRLEELRATQNRVSKEIPQAADKEILLEEMRLVKDEIKILEPEISKLENEIEELAILVPNPPLDSTPDGREDSDHEIIKTHGKKPKFDFTPKDHIELGKLLDVIDIERGVRTSGARFYYLKNDGAMLEFALTQHIIHKLRSKGFAPIIPPVLVKEEAMYATGFFPADRNEVYHVNPDDDDLYLVGTSEVPLTMLHAKEIVPEEKLPIRYCGYSTCFRREAGSYGKDTAGIIRVHQFNKIEMFSFCHPDKSQEEHELIRSIEEEIMQELGFHYQVLNIAAGDLGAPAAKKYDIEVWIPTQEKFRELTSCSNCTDFQARRAQIRYKDKEGNNQYLHTLNGTSIAIARTIVAILENNQQADGSVLIPEILRPYIGNQETITQKI